MTTVELGTGTAPGTPTSRPAAARTRPARRPRRRSSVVLTVAIWTCCGYFLAPFAWLALSSAKTEGDLFTTFGLAPGHSFALLDNVVAAVTADDGVFGLWMANSLWYSVASAAGTVVISTLAGYAFAVYRFAGRNAMFSVVLGAIMVPGTALALPTYLLFAHLGLTNTPLAVILPSLIHPFSMYLVMVYTTDAVDESLLEAARLDRAGELRIFWQISARLLTPVMVTVFLLALVSTWNNYFLPLIMLSEPSLYPVTVGLGQWAAATNGSGGSHIAYTTVITASFLSVLPLVASFLYLQRYWQSGLSVGGVKA